jgi:acyl-coenzyme A synthetase/AMP-(fatty) acid ligase
LASGRDLLGLLREEKITTVTLPPSVLGILLDEDVSREALPDLETVIAAGEACTREIVSTWAPGRKFYNAYGPTETTVCASIKHCDENEPGDPPIGRPIANTQLFVVDRNMQPVPVGIPGELLVGGVGLSRGYLNRPEMTAEKFIPSPFKRREMIMYSGVDDVLYRTGDLVRYRQDGDIEYLGRIDNQVKVRGHRIELGEIEAVIRKHSEIGNVKINEVVVIVREDIPGDQRIVSYLTLSAELDNHEDSGNVIAELKNLLRECLPEFMVPSAYVVLEAMPISPAGKVDRLALGKLPAPEISRQELTVEFVEPRTPIEKELSEIATET